MRLQRIAGSVLLVIAVILLIIGINAALTAPEQVSQTFTERFTAAAVWYVTGGIAAGLVGLAMVLFRAPGTGA